MSRIKAAVVALNQTPLDWEGNITRIRTALSSARREGAELVCLPELCLTGYGCEDAFFAPDTCARAWSVLMDLLPHTIGMVVAFGLPVSHHHALYNCAALVVEGQLVGLVAKQNLAGDGIHYEPRWFKAWPAGVADVFHAPDGSEIPIGDLLFDISGLRIGFEICEDAWVAGRPGGRLTTRAADAILNPSASHFAFGKAEIRRRFVAEGSRSFGVTYLYANLLGNEAGRVIYDGQLLIAHRAYLSLVSQAQGTALNWSEHDITLQNIQARVRAPSIWMFANLRNALLLTTSNRSEAAVGYATMDGDTAGGLAPVSGIDKAFLRHWLRWLETTGPSIGGKISPIPELSVINRQAPTAELRPQESHQTDEDDLMPYDVLDFIERAAIRDHQGPAEILEMLEARFPQTSSADHLRWTRRFFTLWSRNQWKRERYAPGFHLDDENLDPKTWCRWPILSGGFSTELKQLS